MAYGFMGQHGLHTVVIGNEELNEWLTPCGD